MAILDFFLAVFALAPFGLLVLFWEAFHEDLGMHPIYRNSKTETRKKNRNPGHNTAHWNPIQRRQQAELRRPFGSRPLSELPEVRPHSAANPIGKTFNQ
jgi:hypothetical protein